MAKITFVGAGSTVFAQSLIGDCMCREPLRDSHFALYDIDAHRLEDSLRIVRRLNDNINAGRATLTGHLGMENRREALRGAGYVINAIQVGGYEPSTVIDFEIPKKYGLRQTIGDTLGVGGIFRGLRTIPVMLDIAADMEAVCPSAWMLNYTNPMGIVTGAMLRGSPARTVGLCHSVQVCAQQILMQVGLWESVRKLQWKVAGINHQAWLLEVTDDGVDLYPEIRRRAAKINEAARRGPGKHGDMVRLEVLRHFGYYVSESSEHTAEYLPYFIRGRNPELIEEFNIPLDEYPRRCVRQIEEWARLREGLLNNAQLAHEPTLEYGSGIIEAMETDAPYRVAGNVLNTGGLISNLPAKACVEIPCLVDRNGARGCYVGELPEQLAALNRTNINVQLLTIEAALTRRRDRIYQAAMLDPHTAAELTLDQIRGLCDELIEAHGDYLPRYS